MPDAVTHRVDDALVEKVARAMAVQNGRAKGNCDCKRCRAAVYFEDGNARAALEAAGVAELRDALAKCRDLFSEYAAEHQRKALAAPTDRERDERMEKADRNLDMAMMCDRALTNQGKAQADG